MEFLDKKILVVGLGVSGLSLARYLRAAGGRVTVSDIKNRDEIGESLLNEINGLGVELETGGHRTKTFLGSDMIVVSPGVPLEIKPLRDASRRGIPVIGELELASRLIHTPIIAVTGTNGKSTVTSFLGFLLSNAGLRVFVGGNIGTPLIDYAAGDMSDDYVVAEVSSFQLDSADTFRPKVAVLLNISPDHLDRYPTYDDYVRSKMRIFKNQAAGCYAVINDQDRILSKYEPPGGSAVLRYGLKRSPGRNAWLEKGTLAARLPGKEELRFELRGLQLPGRHNLENLMGAVLTAMALSIPEKAVQESINRFQGLAHRIQWVGRIGGVDFYDDSKATNVEAAVRAVASFDRPVVLIAGGRDKGGDYSPLVDCSRKKVRAVFLLGEARGLMAGAFEGQVPCEVVDSMEDAVHRAFESSRAGDVVLLAPACSSFDMFSSYAHRGEVFQNAVRGLKHVR